MKANSCDVCHFWFHVSWLQAWIVYSIKEARKAVIEGESAVLGGQKERLRRKWTLKLRALWPPLCFWIKRKRTHFEFLAHKCKKWPLGIWHNVNSVVEKGTSASVRERSLRAVCSHSSRTEWRERCQERGDAGSRWMFIMCNGAPYGSVTPPTAQTQQMSAVYIVCQS